MNSKQTYKNQDLFSFVFLDEEFKNPLQFKIHLASWYLTEVTKMLSEMPDNKMSVEQYAAYELSMDVGKTFFYFAFIQVFSYQKRLDFLNYQLSQTKDKISFLHRIESLSQMDYWYSFGEYSFYNPETEKVVLDWVVAKYKGSDDPKPLQLIKP